MLSMTKQVGTLGELAVTKQLVEAGFDVFTSVGDCSKIDLIAAKKNRLIRLQVKTVSHPSESGSVIAQAAKITGRQRVIYQSDDFDFLAVHVLSHAVSAFLPLEKLLLRKSKSITLRLSTPLNNQEKRTNNFSDFNVNQLEIFTQSLH